MGRTGHPMASGLTNSAAEGPREWDARPPHGLWTYKFGSVSGPPTLRAQAFGGLERDRSALENGTISLSDVLPQ